jgi:hypothetical protein
MALYEIYNTKYDAMAITGRDKSLRMGFVLVNNTHHAKISKAGQMIQSIPDEWNATWIA